MSLVSDILALSGLVAYYKCDEASGNLLDSSGNSNTLTVSGGITYSVTGQSGNAITFNGSTGMATRASSLIGGTPTTFTVGGFFKMAATTDAFLLGVCNNASNNQIIGYRMGGVASGAPGSRVLPYTRNDAGSGFGGSNGWDALGDLSSSTWRFCVFTYDGTALHGYCDGTRLFDETTALGTTTLNVSTLGCLNRNGGQQNFAPATMQHIFFCTSAISAATIKTLAQDAGLMPSGGGSGGVPLIGSTMIQGRVG